MMKKEVAKKHLGHEPEAEGHALDTEWRKERGLYIVRPAAATP